MTKKVVYPLVAVFLIIAVVLSAVRIYDLNQQYPDPHIITHSLGEEIQGNVTSIAILKSELLDGDEIKTLDPNYECFTKDEKGNILSPQDERFLLVHMKLINYTDDERSMDIRHIVAESDTWANGIAQDIFIDLNSGKGKPTEIRLAPKQEMEIIVPFYLCSVQFKPDDWQKIDNRQFDLVLTLYPEKNIVPLN